MPSVYKIIFVNERGSDGDYAFFAAPPIAHDLSNSPEVYTNAWITQFVPESGTFTIQTTKQFYACKLQNSFTPSRRSRSVIFPSLLIYVLTISK